MLEKQVYRASRKVGPHHNPYYAWRDLAEDAARKLWDVLDTENQGDHWIALRIKKWTSADTEKQTNAYGLPMEYYHIDIHVVPLADHAEPRYAPVGYTAESPNVEVVRGALEELGIRVRRGIRRIFR